MALIDKASLLMVPSTYEDGTLYNVLPSGNKAPDETGNHNGYDQTRADFTFSRGFNLSATRIGPNGLIEKGRENLLLQSNQFDTTWTNTNSTETTGFEGYDGTNNAWKIDITATYGQIIQSVSVSGVNCASVYVKAGTLGFVRLRFDASPNAIVDFDLSDGSTAYTSGIIDASSELIGNGWYRINMVSNVISSTFRIYPLIAANDLTGSSGSIYIQNAQLEAGLVATDYIETGATTATAGVLENTPRIDYSSGAGALLLESQRTNKFTHSEYIGSSDWLKSGNGSGSAPIVTTNYATSPEGVQNATRVQFDAVGTASTDRSTLAQRFAFTTGDVYTLSCWVKATSGSSTMFHMRINGAQVGGEKIATDEWQLFTETHTATATTTDDYGLQIRGSYSSNTSDILIYGMQLENASFGSSYVPTYGSAATRGADTMPYNEVPVTSSAWTAYFELDLEQTELASNIQKMALKHSDNSTVYQTWRLFTRSAQYHCFVPYFNADAEYPFSTNTDNNRTDNGKIVMSANGFGTFKLFTRFNGTTTTQTVTGKSNFTAKYYQMNVDAHKMGVSKVMFFDEALSDSECQSLVE